MSCYCCYCFEPIYKEHNPQLVHTFASDEWAHMVCVEEQEQKIKDNNWLRVRPEVEAVIEAARIVAYNVVQKSSHIDDLRIAMAVFEVANQ